MRSVMGKPGLWSKFSNFSVFHFQIKQCFSQNWNLLNIKNVIANLQIPTLAISTNCDVKKTCLTLIDVPKIRHPRNEFKLTVLYK